MSFDRFGFCFGRVAEARRKMKTILSIIGGIALFSTACSGGEGTVAEGESTTPKVASAKAASTLSGAWFTTAPKAACSLHLEGDTDPAHALKLYADSDGLVSFYADTLADDNAAHAALDCQENGSARTYQVDFRDAALRERPIALPNPNSKVRPALEGDPDAVPQEELLARSYPLRPDRQRSPALYSTWLRAVSQPTTLTDTGFIQTPELANVHYGNGSTTVSGNPFPWGGAELNAPVTYWVALAEWTLPSTVPSVGTPGVYSAAIWGGLDGDSAVGGSTDVIQAGSTLQTIGIKLGSFGSGPVASFGSAFGWAEYFSTNPNPAANETPYNAGLTISLGDTIFIEAAPCDSNGNSNIHGGFAFFLVEDVTTGKSTVTSAPNFIKAPDNTFRGGTAEFIIEKDTSSNNNYLDPYGTLTLAGLAESTDGNLHDFASDPVLIDNPRNFTTIETSQITSADTVAITWLAPQ
jgi:hypothetical protein